MEARKLYSPIALAATTLLCLGRVGVGMAGLGEVLGKSRFTLGSAISNAGVVAISELVRASHFRCQYDVPSRRGCLPASCRLTPMSH
jgi:hypothetical protein